MKVKLSRWGNSLAVRIPAPIADEAQLQEGTSVEIEADGNGGLRLTQLREVPSIDDLVAAITNDNRHEESGWGEPVGNETW